MSGLQRGGKPPVAALVGPTATGKSALAIRLAREFNGEIINADSRLLYRGLDIGTAKPSADELRAVPHHLVDFLEPEQSFGLAQFMDRADALVREISGRGKLPLLVGGTGQYVMGLLEGWDVPRVPPDPEFRRQMESEVEANGPERVHSMLRDMDPEAAGRIDPRNVRRVIRALEVARAHGSPARRWDTATNPPYEFLALALQLPRDDLYARVDARIDSMLLNGWIEEVRQLLQRGVRSDAPAMGSIGYREIAAYIAGEITLNEALRRARKATRALVRHQDNWFRRHMPDAVRITALPMEDAAVRAESTIYDWLGAQ